MAEGIFAVARIERNAHPSILTTYRTIEELTEYYAGLVQKNRRNIELDPVEIHGGLTFVLNDVRYKALESVKRHSRERRVA